MPALAQLAFPTVDDWFHHALTRPGDDALKAGGRSLAPGSRQSSARKAGRPTPVASKPPSAAST